MIGLIDITAFYSEPEEHFLLLIYNISVALFLLIFLFLGAYILYITNMKIRKQCKF